MENQTDYIKNLEEQIQSLKNQLLTKKSSHRKYEVLNLLKQKPHTTSELAIALNTSKNNIGSLLTYLRQDNIIIHRNHLSQHYLPETTN